MRFKFDQALCLCVDNETSLGTDANSVAMLASTQAILSIETEAACARRNAGKVLEINAPNLLDKLHFLSAGAVCFARGLNDTPKIAALLLLTPMLNIQWIIVLVAVLMALGGLFSARRVAETMSHKITEISHGQGLVANLTTAFLVIVASYLGMPVSTTHVSVGSLFGIGLTNGKARKGMMGSILFSWLLTLPCAAFCAAVIYHLCS
jgi:PiT family inorganic phosphate transporter